MTASARAGAQRAFYGHAVAPVASHHPAEHHVLTSLAPDIVEAILAADEPSGLSPATLRGGVLLGWGEQWQAVGPGGSGRPSGCRDDGRTRRNGGNTSGAMEMVCWRLVQTAGGRALHPDPRGREMQEIHARIRDSS